MCKLPEGRLRRVEPFRNRPSTWDGIRKFVCFAPYGQGAATTDAHASLQKDGVICKRCTTQFRTEGLSTQNYAYLGNPDLRQASPLFGQVTSLVNGNQDQIIQLGWHLHF